MKRDVFDYKALYPALRARLFREVEPIVKAAYAYLIRHGSINGDDEKWAIWNRMINRNLVTLEYYRSWDHGCDRVTEEWLIVPVLERRKDDDGLT